MRRLMAKSGLAMVLSFLFCAHLSAQMINVVKPGSAKESVDLTRFSVEGTDGQEFLSVLALNLDRSGWFKVDSTGAGIFKVDGTFRRTSSSTRVTYRITESKSGSVLAESSLSGTSDDTRQLARELCDAIVKAVKHVPGIATSRIVMVGTPGSQKDIYVITSDGLTMSRVTRDHTRVVVRPRWSPDGRQVVYTSDVGGFVDIYETDLATSRRKTLVSLPGSNIGSSLSPDGTRLAFCGSRDGNPELYMIHVGSVGLTRLSNTDHAAEGSPAWSPDGRNLVYVSNQYLSNQAGQPQLFIMDMASRRPQRLALHGQSNEAPDWGPDGRIVFASRRSGSYQICTYDPRSGMETQLTSEAVDSEDPSWAPDSRHIVCSRRYGHETSVYILDTQGDPPLRLTKSGADWYSPDWAP